MTPLNLTPNPHSNSTRTPTLMFLTLTLTLAPKHSVNPSPEANQALHSWEPKVCGGVICQSRAITISCSYRYDYAKHMVCVSNVHGSPCVHIHKFCRGRSKHPLSRLPRCLSSDAHSSI